MNCGICCPECLCDTVNCSNKVDCYNDCGNCDDGITPFACNTSSPTTSYPTTNIPTSTTSTPSNAPLTSHEYCQICCPVCPTPTPGYCTDCHQNHCANCTVAPTTTPIAQVECEICCPACLCSLDSESPYCKDSCFPYCNDCIIRRRLFDCNETTLIPTTSNPTTVNPTTPSPTTSNPTTANPTTFNCNYNKSDHSNTNHNKSDHSNTNHNNSDHSPPNNIYTNCSISKHIQYLYH
eukprot:316401_1